MISFLLSLFKGQKEQQKPRWRLKPDQFGTYYLEEYSPGTDMYWCRAAYVRDQEHADELIANLERETVYKTVS